MKDFTTGGIPRQMVSFLGPLLLSNTMQALFILVDAFWAGRLLGSSGVAVVASGMPVVFLLSSLFAGLVVGAAILAGQAFGSGNKNALSGIASSSLIATIVLSAGISAAGIAALPVLLRLIGTPAALYADTRIFLTILMAGMILGSLVQWFSALLNAAGDSRTPFRIIVIALIVNAVLAPVLITGAGIMRPLGIAGSALATVTAHLCAVAVCALAWRGHRISMLAPLRARLDGPVLMRIISVGLPLGLQMIVVSSSFLFILALVNRFGPAATAAFGIGSRVDQFAFLALFAVTAAISAMTAQNYGAGRMDRVDAIARWGLGISLGIAALFFGAVMLAPDAITGVFTRDPEVIALTRGYFRTIGIGYLGLAVLFSYQGVLRGAGDTLASFIMVGSTMVLVRVPLCYGLAFGASMGLGGLWLGVMLSSMLGAGAFWIYYRSGWWRRGTRVLAEHRDSPHGTCLPEEAM